MMLSEDDRQRYIAEKTRHRVGRVALGRVSRIVQTWQAEEQENTRLAKHIFLIALLLAASGGIFYFLFR